MHQEDLSHLRGLCAKYELTLALFPNGEEVSLIFRCGDFEHPREAIQWILETFQEEETPGE